jgi:hypothetical protein
MVPAETMEPPMTTSIIAFISRLALIAALLCGAAQADTLGRALDGAVITTDDTTLTAVVFWSLDCDTCGQDMAALQARGVRLVAVNTDAASSVSCLRSFAHRHGITSPILSDADGQLRQRFSQSDDQSVILINGQGKITWQQQGEHMAIAEVIAQAGKIQLTER